MIGKGTSSSTPWVDYSRRDRLRAKLVARGGVVNEANSGGVLSAGRDPELIDYYAEEYMDAPPEARDDIMNCVKDLDERLHLGVLLKLCAVVLADIEADDLDADHMAALMMRKIIGEARPMLGLAEDADLWVCRLGQRRR